MTFRRLVVPILTLLLAISGLAVAQEFGGIWEFEVDIDPHEPVFSDSLSFESFIRVDYTVSEWTFSSLTRVGDAGWEDQDFLAAGVLGPFSLSASMDFSPPTSSFGSLITNVTVSVDNVILGSRFRLQGGNTFLTLTARGTTGSVALSARVELGESNGVCDFPFKLAVITAAFPFCCFTLTSTLAMSDTGFDQIAFSTTRLPMAEWPWITVDARVVFTVQSKSVTLTPRLNIPTTPCVDIYMTMGDEGWFSLVPVSLDGFRLVCTFDHVTFTAVSYWGEESKPGVLSGTPYWEAYVIESRQDTCCGPFSFDLSVFFIENGLRLFDVALITANVEVAFSEQVTFRMGMDVDTETDTIPSWRLGFVISW